MALHKIGTGIVGVATVIGTVVAVLAYCSPPASNQPLTVVPKLALPKVRPLDLPIAHTWTNASGPPTFELMSSAAVIEDGDYGNDLHVRFLLTNRSAVPVRVWARAESASRNEDVEAWTVDTGTVLCSSQPDQITTIPVGDPEENLIRYRDAGRVIDRSPQLASNKQLAFSARFRCKGPVRNDAILFATIRTTLAYRAGRNTVYFQTTNLPLFKGR